MKNIKELKIHINTIVTLLTLVTLIVGGTVTFTSIVASLDANMARLEQKIDELQEEFDEMRQEREEDLFIYGIAAINKFIPYMDGTEEDLYLQMQLSTTNNANLIRACDNPTVKQRLIDYYNDEQLIKTLCRVARGVYSVPFKEVT